MEADPWDNRGSVTGTLHALNRDGGVVIWSEEHQQNRWYPRERVLHIEDLGRH
jgi:hypothetical protein